MTAHRPHLPLAAFAAFALLLAACGGSGSGDDASTQQVDVALTSAGCDPPAIEVPAGPTTFHVRNDGAAAVTEFELLDGDHVLGEAENLIEGLEDSFTLTLEQGEYTTYCPGGTSAERGTLVVTAPPA